MHKQLLQSQLFFVLQIRRKVILKQCGWVVHYSLQYFMHLTILADRVFRSFINPYSADLDLLRSEIPFP